MMTGPPVRGCLYILTSVPQMPATSIFIRAPSSGISGMGNSRISVLLGPTLTAASTFSIASFRTNWPASHTKSGAVSACSRYRYQKRIAAPYTDLATRNASLTNGSELATALDRRLRNAGSSAQSILGGLGERHVRRQHERCRTNTLCDRIAPWRLDPLLQRLGRAHQPMAGHDD